MVPNTAPTEPYAQPDSVSNDGTTEAASRAEEAIVNSIPNPPHKKLEKSEKTFLTAFCAFGGLLASMSTTNTLAAGSELAETYNTTVTAINLTNAIYLISLGASCSFWGPLSDVFGRKPAYVASTGLFLVFSVATALAPTYALFLTFRLFLACQAAAFFVVGPSSISDAFHPTERGTCFGWFSLGCMFGPALSPFLSGVIVTFTSWRAIFWLQAALAGIALLQAVLFFRETLRELGSGEFKGKGLRAKVCMLWERGNPTSVFAILRKRNVLFVIFASSTMAWNMYALLTPIRYVLNPRFNLTTPLQTGLLYLAPGLGYVLGTQIGGRWADYTVKTWAHKRGFRVPEDRLRSGIFFLGGVLPISTLLYGWSVDRDLGGITLPLICMVLQGAAQTCAFPSLNVYILDVFEHRSGNASACHYFMRYSFSAAATACSLPLIESVGVGWTTTLSAIMVMAGSIPVLFVANWSCH